MIRRDAILGGLPAEIFATAQLEAVVEILRGSEWRAVPDISDAQIFRGVFARDGLGGVGGCIVADEKLEIAECLSEDLIEAGAQMFLAISNGDTDTDSGRLPSHDALPFPRAGPPAKK